MYLIEVKETATGTCYSFNAIDSVRGFEAHAIKDNFNEEEEVNQSPLSEAVIRYDQDLKEYQFDFNSACKLLRNAVTIFKPVN